MAYPKYVRAKGKQLYYQRDYPTKTQQQVGKKTYSAPLGLAVGAGESAITRAAIEHTERFELNCKVAANSDLNAYADAEVDKLALQIIDKVRMAAGDLQTIRPGQFPEEFDNQWVAEIALGEERIDEVIDKHNRNEALSVHDKAMLRAREMLITKKRKQPVYLSQLWDQYIQHRGIDVKVRPHDKAQKRWDRFFAIIGEQVATRDLIDSITDALQDYADQRSSSKTTNGTAPSQSTIERELSDIMSCLKLASKRHRLQWHITRPYIKPTPKSVRHPLSRDEQRKLITALYAHDLSDNEKMYATLAILYLQGGMMASEVQRLEPEDYDLEATIPHIVIRNDTKTNARKRILPVVVGLGFIREHLDRTIAWLNTITESNYSALQKRLLRKITSNPKITAHCLRHSFRANAQAVGADLLTIAYIAGWSDAQRNVSEHLLNYGSEGITSSELVKKLYIENQKINAHLIETESALFRSANKQPHTSNVVPFNRA